MISVSLAEELGDLAEVVVCTSNLAVTEIYLGRTSIAYATSERAFRLCHRLGDTDSVTSGSIQISLGLSALLLGHFSEAIGLWNDALSKFIRGGGATWRAVAESHLGAAYLHLGQPARARSTLTPIGAEALPSTRARRLAVEARIDRACGTSGEPRLREALALMGESGEPFNTMLAELDMSREMEARLAAERCAQVRNRAEQLEHFGVATKARFLRIEALLRAGEVHAACAEAREAVALLEHRKPVDMVLPECWWIAFSAFEAVDAQVEARASLACAVDWIQQQALPNVPPEFRDSFLHRNAINRSVLTTAARRLSQ